jgi:hypothetical protein
MHGHSRVREVARALHGMRLCRSTLRTKPRSFGERIASGNDARNVVHAWSRFAPATWRVPKQESLSRIEAD